METKKKTRKKIYLEFDEEKRKQFLTGFHQRKLERKRKAKEELELRKKEEKKKLKEERKNIIKEMHLSQRSVPEVEHLVDPVTYELPEHTVIVTSVDDIDFVGYDGTRLGINKFGCPEQDGNSQQDEGKFLKKLNDLKTVTKKLKKQKYLSKLQKKKSKHKRGSCMRKHSKQHTKKRDKKALRFKQS